MAAWMATGWPRNLYSQRWWRVAVLAAMEVQAGCALELALVAAALKLLKIPITLSMVNLLADLTACSWRRAHIKSITYTSHSHEAIAHKSESGTAKGGSKDFILEPNLILLAAAAALDLFATSRVLVITPLMHLLAVQAVAAVE